MENIKHVIMIGAARSGIAVAEYITKHGQKMTLNDSKNYEQLRKEPYGIESLDRNDLVEKIYGRQPTEEEVAQHDLMVLSPGVPPDCLPCQLAQKNMIPIISEIEFADQYYQGRVIAITGTNGKTTTTTLTGELLKACGYDAHVGGNIGQPFISFADGSDDNSVIALEISSFQLSMLENLHPNIGIITNLTPDHLDRHKTFENYIQAKAKIFQNMKDDDIMILNYDDKNARDLSAQIQCRTVFFTVDNDPTKDAYLKDDTIMVKIDGQDVALIDRKDLNLLGKHNAANVMCAALAVLALGSEINVVQKTLKEFMPVANRMEFVAKKSGVTYINDSKGTNPDASITALTAIDDPIVMILGGYDKESSFDELFDWIDKKVKHIVVLGQTKEKIAQTALKHSYENITLVNTFQEAVNISSKIAQEGDYVLLSPACASWDMFDDYEQRGELFRNLVHEL